MSTYSIVKSLCTLVRIDRPVGISLLFLPCLWGLALAGDRKLPLREGILFLIGSILMRSAGCVYNDIVDVRIDRCVERTLGRPLAKGTVSINRAVVILCSLLLLSLIVLLQFNNFTKFMGLISIALVVAYPWMKRFTNFPQIFLGLTFNWGIFLGWVSIKNNISCEPIILYFSGILWTIGYDTLYAFQDVEDDIKIGVRSSAIIFLKRHKIFLVILFTIMHILILSLGLLREASKLFYITWILLVVSLYSQVLLVKIQDKKNVLNLFRFNGWIVGPVVLLCILLI